MKRCTVVALVLAATSCKPSDSCVPKDSPLPLQILAAAGSDLNPHQDGSPWSTNLLIYELRSGANLDELDFGAVHENPDKVFGDALVKSYKQAIYPNGRERWTFELDPATTHVITVALFQEPLGDAWYQVFKVPVGHHEQACQAAARGRPIGPPCLYLAFEQYEVNGGRFPPAGFDLSEFKTTCAPIVATPVKAKRKRKSPSIPSVPSIPTVPKTPSAPTAPTVSTPTTPAQPTAPNVPRRSP